MKEKDKLFDEAVRAVRLHGRASCAFLQRKLKIGYFYSALLLDQLEEHGIVSPVDKAKPAAPRKLL